MAEDIYRWQREVYDLVHGATQDHDREVTKLLKRVRGAVGNNPNSWLDCACGTGLHLAALQRAGISVLAGMDNSPSQLEVAGENLSGIPLHLADLRNFEVVTPPGGFDVVSCLLSSVGHLHSDEDYLAALRSMAAHLHSKGVVVVEPWIALEDFRPGRLDIDEVKLDGGRILQITKHSLSGTEACPLAKLEFRFLMSGEEQAVVRDWTMEMELRLRSLEEQLALFGKVFSSVDFQSTGAGSRGVFLARKPR